MKEESTSEISVCKYQDWYKLWYTGICLKAISSLQWSNLLNTYKIKKNQQFITDALQGSEEGAKTKTVTANPNSATHTVSSS